MGLYKALTTIWSLILGVIWVMTHGNKCQWDFWCTTYQLNSTFLALFLEIVVIGGIAAIIILPLRYIWGLLFHHTQNISPKCP